MTRSHLAAATPLAPPPVWLAHVSKLTSSVYIDFLQRGKIRKAPAGISRKKRGATDLALARVWHMRAARPRSCFHQIGRKSAHCSFCCSVLCRCSICLRGQDSPMPCWALFAAGFHHLWRRCSATRAGAPCCSAWQRPAPRQSQSLHNRMQMQHV